MELNLWLNRVGVDSRGGEAGFMYREGLYEQGLVFTRWFVDGGGTGAADGEGWKSPGLKLAMARESRQGWGLAKSRVNNGTWGKKNTNEGRRWVGEGGGGRELDGKSLSA